MLTGHPVGDFLDALLLNNLVEAFGRADQNNERAMKGWCALLYWYMPSTAWKSREAIDRWIESGGLRGQELARKAGA